MDATAWSQLATAFALGLVGSGHCALVCGPILVAHLGARGAHVLNGAPSRCGAGGALHHVLALSAGRIAMYMLLAAAVSTAGRGLGAITRLSDALRTATAVLMIAMGAHLLGWSRVVSVVGSGMQAALTFASGGRHAQAVGRSPASNAVAGLVWGAMPCGMAYTAILWAGLATDAAGASLLMLAFGLGTLPALVTTGLFAARMRRAVRHARPLGGVALIVFGVLALPWLQVLAARHVMPRLPAELQGVADFCSSSLAPFG
jgi:sulfite exporter TauE/SafE